MSRESLAHALSGPVSLQEDQWRTRDVDKLHALAAAANFAATERQAALYALGVSLLALRNANRPDEYVRAVNGLANILRDAKPRAKIEMRVRIARQAVQEFIVDFCGACQGKGEIPDQDGLEGAQRMKPCPECGGHGKRRYSDSERVEVVGGRPVDVGAWMSYANSLVSLAESEAVRTANRLMERW